MSIFDCSNILYKAHKKCRHLPQKIIRPLHRLIIKGYMYDTVVKTLKFAYLGFNIDLYGLCIGKKNIYYKTSCWHLYFRDEYPADKPGPSCFDNNAIFSIRVITLFCLRFQQFYHRVCFVAVTMYTISNTVVFVGFFFFFAFLDVTKNRLKF